MAALKRGETEKKKSLLVCSFIGHIYIYPINMINYFCVFKVIVGARKRSYLAPSFFLFSFFYIFLLGDNLGKMLQIGLRGYIFAATVL